MHDHRGRPIEVGTTVRRVPDHHTYRVITIRDDGIDIVRDDGQRAWFGAGVSVEVDPGTPRPVGGVGDVAQALLDALPPGPVRELVAERRERGLTTYGRPLAVYGDGLDTWHELLRPELGDVLVYLTRILVSLHRSQGPSRPWLRLADALLRALDPEAALDNQRGLSLAVGELSRLRCPACDGAGDDPTCPTCGSPTW